MCVFLCVCVQGEGCETLPGVELPILSGTLYLQSWLQSLLWYLNNFLKPFNFDKHVC